MSIQEKYPYFSILIRINNLYFNDIENYNLRLSNEEDLSYFESLLSTFFYISNITDDINTILFYLLTITGKLLNYQPFYDGNSRTLKQFIKTVLQEIGYNLEYNQEDFIIPMLFDNEVVSNEKILCLKRKIFF